MTVVELPVATRSPATLIAVAVASLAIGFGGTVLIYYSNSSCPCGFGFDPLTGGCQVTLGPVDCGGTSPTPGADGSPPPAGSGGATVPGGVGVGSEPLYCNYRVTNCTLNPEKTAVSYVVENHNDVLYISGDGPALKVNISQKPCASISGTVVAPSPNTAAQTIPISVAAAQMHPGLTVGGKGDCPGSPTKMSIYPDKPPLFRHVPQECGCSASFR